MPSRNPRLRDRVLNVVRETPWLSSQEVANRVGRAYGSTSSLLLRLVREGVLTRAEDCGPRHGWGYALPGAPPPSKGLPTDKTPRPVQDQVLEVLQSHPWYTVAELAHAMGRNHGSVYSALQGLVKIGRAKTMEDCGTRGGTGYADRSEQGLRIKGEYITRPTLWEHLED